jgi:hypothetical protein
MRENITWSAVWIAGFVGGTVFLVTSILFTPLLLGVESGLVLRYFASLVMGEAVVNGDVTTTSSLIVGVIVHYALSMLFALVIAIVVHRWGLLVGIIGGALLGLAIYGINLYTMTLLFPWFFAINNSVLLVSHVLFGALVGGVYEMFDHYDQPFKNEVTA